MASKPKKVLRFPEPAPEPDSSSIICQIGDQRFAIHYQIEDLPAPPPVIPIQKAKP